MQLSDSCRNQTFKASRKLVATHTDLLRNENTEHHAAAPSIAGRTEQMRRAREAKTAASEGLSHFLSP